MEVSARFSNSHLLSANDYQKNDKVKHKYTEDNMAKEKVTLNFIRNK